MQVPRIMCMIIVVAALSGCELLPGPGGSTAQPPAAILLPNLPGYTVVEGQTLTGYIGKLSGGAALLTGQPELAITLTEVDAIIGCYQQVGAVRARVYSSQATPLSAGAVAIADKQALLDPTNLFRCVAPSLRPQAQAIKIEPCKASYTLTQDGNEFYILYAGTTQEICQAFCRNLQSCTAHR